MILRKNFIFWFVECCNLVLGLDKGCLDGSGIARSLTALVSGFPNGERLIGDVLKAIF
jgi:hypothetical protein